MAFSTPLQARAFAHFESLCAAAGLPPPVADEPMALVFDASVLVDIGIDEARQTLVLRAPVHASAQPLAATYLAVLLAVNFDGRGTQGARFALRDADAREVVLVLDLAGEVDYATFEAAVQQLVASVLAWRAVLEEDAAGPPAGEALPTTFGSFA
jgi:hypothetical protein